MTCHHRHDLVLKEVKEALDSPIKFVQRSLVPVNSLSINSSLKHCVSRLISLWIDPHDIPSQVR